MTTKARVGRGGAPAADEVEGKIRRAVELFARRSSLDEATLTLDGTGPNGPLQMAVIGALGAERLQRLRRINVISGSVFSFLGMMAGHAGEHYYEFPELIRDGDVLSRQAHRAGLLRVLRFALLDAWRKRPMFDHEAHSRLLGQFVTEEFSRTRVGELPCNAAFWLYDVDARELVCASRDSELGSATVAEVAQCVAAVPRLYPPGRIGGRRFIDPVYSGAYRELMSRLRREGKPNHLIANVVRDRIAEHEIYLQSHDHPDGVRMIRNDFLRMALNLPNPRVADAYRVAQRLSPPSKPRRVARR